MEVDFSTASDKGDKVDKNAGKWIYLILKTLSRHFEPKKIV